MKIERLYAITVYLLNHGRTSAAELARQFEVSVRTIQRDIDSLGLAGIPVAAFSGRDGGYEIAERFRMDSRLADAGDYSRILTALGGLVSATGDQETRRTLEKIAGMAGPGTGMILDFSVLREGEQPPLETLRAAVREKPATTGRRRNVRWSRWRYCTGGIAGICWPTTPGKGPTGPISWFGCGRSGRAPRLSGSTAQRRKFCAGPTRSIPGGIPKSW